MNKNFIYIIGFALLFLTISCSKDNALEDPVIDENGQKYPDGTIPPNPYWGWVQAFPGVVPVDEPRIESTVAINYINTGEEYWQSTGLYIPPGEEVIINIAAGMNNLYYRIGGFNDVLGSSSKRYYDMDINDKFEIGENTLFSYFGGHLYVYSDGTPVQTQIEVKGAVKSPDFILGSTDSQQWKEEIKNSLVPWTEIITENIILTLPVSLMQQVEDIESFASFYNDFIKIDFNEFFNVSETKVPLRFRLDPDITSSIFGSNIGGKYPLVVDTSLDSLVVGLPQFNTMDNTYTLAQVFNLAYPIEEYTSSLFRTSFSKLPYYRVYNRHNIFPEYTDDFSVAVGYIQSSDMSKGVYDLSEIQRTVMFIQLAQEYGWNLYGYMIKKISEDAEPEDDQHMIDAVAMYATEYANTNLAPFFKAWGVTLSRYAINYMAQYPSVGSEFWKTYGDKIGSVDNRTPVTMNKGSRPDFVDADRSQWNAVSYATIKGEVVENKHVESASIGEYNLMFDGAASTVWHSIWESNNGRYPHIMEIDMNEEVAFNYIYWTHRSTSNHYNKCRLFQIFIKDNSGEWVELEEDEDSYYLCKQAVMQRIYFKNTYTTQYIKLVMLAPHPKTGESYDETPDQRQSVSIAEFGVGTMQ